MRDLFERYELTYTEGPLPKVLSAWRKVIRLSLPNDAAQDAADAVVTELRTRIDAAVPFAA